MFLHKRSVEKCVQDEKDFTLEAAINHQHSRVYDKSQKIDISDNPLFHTTSRQSVKEMQSVASRGTAQQSHFSSTTKTWK